MSNPVGSPMAKETLEFAVGVQKDRVDEKNEAYDRLASVMSDPSKMAPKRFKRSVIACHMGRSRFTNKGQLEVKMLVLPAFVDTALVLGAISGLPVKVTIEAWNGEPLPPSEY